MKLLRSWRRVVLSVVREASPEYPAPSAVKHGGDVAALVRTVIGSDPREHFVAVYLDSKHKPVGVHVVSIGTADACTVHPREVFAPAVLLAATTVVVAHNHPSGDPTPSSNDHEVTDRLRKAGELLGIELLDHLVLGEARYYSFASSCQYPYA